jgi:hypothetical protein
MTNEEKIDFIDTFLSQCEDYMHGQDGKDVTLSRKYLREIAEQVKNSVVLDDVVGQSEQFICGAERVHGEERCDKQCGVCLFEYGTSK